MCPSTGEAWVAELHCRNRLTAMTDPDVAADLQIGGLTVHLLLEQTVGRAPDTFTVMPQDGFVADPPVMSLDEDAEGVVRVFHWLGF